MNPIIRFFRAIDDGLTICVDYTANRIFTGKFMGDIQYINALVKAYLSEKKKKYYGILLKSPTFFKLVTILKIVWQTFIKIPLFNVLVFFIANTLKILIHCYSEIFIVFALTFPTMILLLNWFQTAVVAFFIGLIPFLLFDLICFSALYYFIKQKAAGEHISYWKCMQLVFQRFGTISFPLLILSAIIQETIIGYFIVALFFSYVFGIINIAFGSSIFYWFVIVFLGFLVAVGIFLLSMVLYQAYFLLLFEKISLQQALKLSRLQISTNLRYFLLFYVLLYIISAFYISKATASFLYLGFTLGSYFAFVVGTLLAFLLSQRFPAPSIPQDNVNKKGSLGYTILVIFGLINYVLLAIFIVKEYHPLIAFVQQQDDSYLASQEMKQYVNTAYQYTLQYPQTWTLYQWNENSVTFYNNYTGTATGGTWMAINVSTFNKNAFDQLFNANPGLVIEVGLTKDVTTKVTNMTIQGYDTVNYTFLKANLDYPQYETHYLIHKGNLMYDIAFVSITNDVANYDNDLFQKIINSFQFTK